MSPLFTAVPHGCAAGHHLEVFKDVFLKRIQRGYPPYSIHTLGAIHANLMMLHNFFKIPWKETVPELTHEKDFLFGAVGVCLRALGHLNEAVPLFEGALDLDVAEKSWEGAAADSANLSEVHMARGDLVVSLKLANQAVKFADITGHWFTRCYARTCRGTVFHQMARFAEAITDFRDAEQIQIQNQPEFSVLYAYQGFRYSDLLLDLQQISDAKKRALTGLSLAKMLNSLLSAGLDNLILARASLMEAKAKQVANPSISDAFTLAVEGIRSAGIMDVLPLGLLARAEFFRFTREFSRSEKDLNEAFRIATRNGMNLHLIDYHLESARLRLAQGDKFRARENYEIAKEKIDLMGYHRRNKEITEIKKYLLSL